MLLDRNEMGKPQSKPENESGQQLVTIIDNQSTHSEFHKEHSLKLTVVSVLVIIIVIVIIIKAIKKVIRIQAEKAARMAIKLNEPV